MKKLVALLLAALLMLSGSAALANVADEVALGEAMTHEELLEKALAEEGSFVVYGNTSRIATPWRSSPPCTASPARPIT